jgi:hypothetical protein
MSDFPEGNMTASEPVVLVGEVIQIAASGSRRRGRPSTGQAKSGAERQRLYRERKAGLGKEELPSIWLSSDVMAALKRYVNRQNADIGSETLTLGDAVERILRDRLLRKR